MTNEEIKIEIQKHQFELQKALTECCATFELNQNIAIHKKAIDALRHKCTHQNDNHEFEVSKGRCLYCGAKV